MKKSITVTLLVIFILQTGGILLVYKIKQWYVYEQVHESLNNKDIFCQKMMLSLKDYRKSKINSDEIFYDGKMFDVRSVIVLDSIVELAVFRDLEEENILEEICEYIRSKFHYKDFPDQLYQFFSMVYLFQDNKYVFFVFSKRVTFFNYGNLHAIPGNSSISTPPPRRV